jgi:hypothetical protein
MTFEVASETRRYSLSVSGKYGTDQINDTS